MYRYQLGTELGTIVAFTDTTLPIPGPNVPGIYILVPGTIFSKL